MAESAFHMVTSGYALYLTRSLPEARRQALLLYRRSLRACEDIKRLYQVPISVEDMRRKIRVDFELHGNVDDVDVADMLVLKGYNLLEEAIENFTFRAHIWRYFEEIPLRAKKHETPQERLEREVYEEMLSPDPRQSVARPVLLE